MSTITTANNLSVNNSLTVNSNTVLGSDDTSTLIVNSHQTLNNGTIINGAITHLSGSFTSSGDTMYLNCDVLIGNAKKLTTSTGETTINSTLTKI